MKRNKARQMRSRQRYPSSFMAVAEKWAIRAEMMGLVRRRERRRATLRLRFLRKELKKRDDCILRNELEIILRRRRFARRALKRSGKPSLSCYFLPSDYRRRCRLKVLKRLRILMERRTFHWPSESTREPTG